MAGSEFLRICKTVHGVSHVIEPLQHIRTIHPLSLFQRPLDTVLRPDLVEETKRYSGISLTMLVIKRLHQSNQV